MTSRQIDKRQSELQRIAKRTDEEELEYREMWFREMINSCLTYGGPYGIHDGKEWGHYGKKYAQELGEERAMKVWKEQRDFFYAHAIISSGMFTDSEGCSYNSVSWDVY